MGTPMKRVVFVRKVEVCPNCGCWNPFRKTKGGRSIVDRVTGLRRIYGSCRSCGMRITVQYVSSGEKCMNITPLG